MSPDKTNISPTPIPISRQRVVDEARTWLGTRWVHQGRSRAGVDCAGLVIRVVQDVGTYVEDITGYRRNPDTHNFLNHIRKHTQPAPVIKPGAICVFRQTVFPCHVGFFTEKDGIPHIIHSFLGTASVIEEPFIHSWPDLLVEVRDLIGIEA